MHLRGPLSTLHFFLLSFTSINAKNSPTNAVNRIKVPTPPTTTTQYSTVTSTSTVTMTEFYRAGLVLSNMMTISGIDAYQKDFTVDNQADVELKNSQLNVFAIPSTATCAMILTLSI